MSYCFHCPFSEDSDIKAAIAALSFILSSAAKHSVDGDSLSNEMQQLGLPKGCSCYLIHCAVTMRTVVLHFFALFVCPYLFSLSENAGSLCKVYADNLSKLQEVFRAKSLRGSLCNTLH